MEPKKLLVELLGTLTLILIGAGSVAISGDLLIAAFAHGFVVLGLAYTYGDISGLHINPAVTLGLWAGGKIALPTAVAYILAQLLGGTIGTAVLAFTLGGPHSGLGATTLAPTVTPAQGLVVEMLLTFFLMSGIYHAAVFGKAGDMAPIAISCTLIFCILMGGPLTGASLNPARTLGPALFTGNFAHLWLYMLGPTTGAITAALFHTHLLAPPSST